MLAMMAKGRLLSLTEFILMTKGPDMNRYTSHAILMISISGRKHHGHVELSILGANLVDTVTQSSITRELRLLLRPKSLI